MDTLPQTDASTNVDINPRLEVTLSQIQDILVSHIIKLTSGDRLSITCSHEVYKYLQNSDLSSIFSYCFNGFEDHFNIPPLLSKVLEDSSLLFKLANDFNLDTRLLMDSYYHLNEKKYNKKSLRELIWDDATTGLESSKINFNTWAISVDQYNYLSCLVSEAITVFEKIGNQELIKEDCASLFNVVDKETLSMDLGDSITELKKARRTINSQLAQTSKAWNKDAVMNYKEVYQAYILFKDDFDQFTIRNGDKIPKKPGLLTFNKSLEKVFQDFESLSVRFFNLLDLARQNDIYDSKLLKIESIGSITAEVNNINFGLTTWEQCNSKRQLEKMQRLSTLNVNNTGLKNAQILIDETIIKLNKLSVKKSKWECNTNSSLMHLVFIENTIIEIERMLQILSQNEALVEKDRFMASLNSADQSFIKKFLEHPISDWMNEFHKYFKPLLTRSLYHPLAISDDIILNKIMENATQLATLQMKALPALLDSIFSNNIGVLKQNNSKFFKQFVNGVSNIYKQDYYKADIEMLQNLFPIEFIKSNPNEDVVLVKSTGSKNCIEMKLLAEDRLLELNKINAPISTTHITGQYQVANSLATCLCEFANQINIYQLKSANIISVIPSSNPDVLVKQLDKYGVKKLRPVHGIVEGVKDCILSYERQQYLLIMNGLIDDTKPQDALAQRNIIKKFETAGYEIINIWSIDLMYDADVVFESIVSKVAD